GRLRINRQAAVARGEFAANLLEQLGADRVGIVVVQRQKNLNQMHRLSLRWVVKNVYAWSWIGRCGQKVSVNIACRERTMSYLSNRSASSSLAVLVECVVSPLLREHPAPICFELNVPLELTTTADRNRLSELVGSLVRDSL